MLLDCEEPAPAAAATALPEVVLPAEERPKGKRPVAATVFCSFGAGLAQLPFIATQLGERRRGHARSLCNAVCNSICLARMAYLPQALAAAHPSSIGVCAQISSCLICLENVMLHPVAELQSMCRASHNYSCISSGHIQQTAPV